MPMVSISDIGRSIATSSDVYNREMGAFSAFLSPERRAGFHRINIEYMQAMSNQTLSDIAYSVRQGTQLNAELLNVNYRISDNLDEIARYTYENHQQIRKTNEILNEILATLKNPNSTAASEKARIAAQNIAEAKQMSEKRAKRLLDEALELLVESVSISPFDYKAHFDLGWLYSFYMNDLKNAEKAFDNAVLRSIQKDPSFAVFSLRHLADTRQMLGDNSGALEAIEEAVELRSGDVYQTRLEYGQHLIHSAKEKKAASEIENLIGDNNSYFDIAITDPILSSCELVNNSMVILLNVRKKKTLRKIQEEVNINPTTVNYDLFTSFINPSWYIGHERKTIHEDIPSQLKQQITKVGKKAVDNWLKSNSYAVLGDNEAEKKVIRQLRDEISHLGDNYFKSKYRRKYYGIFCWS